MKLVAIQVDIFGVNRWEPVELRVTIPLRVASQKEGIGMNIRIALAVPRSELLLF
jgi:hypothetical protein